MPSLLSIMVIGSMFFTSKSFDPRMAAGSTPLLFRLSGFGQEPGFDVNLDGYLLLLAGIFFLVAHRSGCTGIAGGYAPFKRITELGARCRTWPSSGQYASSAVFTQLSVSSLQESMVQSTPSLQSTGIPGWQTPVTGGVVPVAFA